jgi:hypothetical protein
MSLKLTSFLCFRFPQHIHVRLTVNQTQILEFRIRLGINGLYNSVEPRN